VRAIDRFKDIIGFFPDHAGGPKDGKGGAGQVIQSVSHIVNTQLRLLAAASQRDDRAPERPSNLTGGAAGKVVAMLLTEGLVEEIQSRVSLSVWRRDGDNAHTLRSDAEAPIRLAGALAKTPDVPKCPLLYISLTAFGPKAGASRRTKDNGDEIHASLPLPRANIVAACGRRMG
jgi:hypothetical protein